MAKNIKKTTLANKLAKKGDVIKPTTIISKQARTDNVRDIEDLVGVSSNATGSSNSIYFSPIRTRKQRVINGESLKNNIVKVEALSPTRVAPKKNKKEDQLVSKLQIGSATVVKCKIVPDVVDSPIRIDNIKKELEPQIKKEIDDIKEGLVKIKKEVNSQEESQLYHDVEAPHPFWYNHLENIRNMRNSNSAPVDTMGCHRCADSTADAKTQRFQNLVALMLSSQTKDQTTYEAMNRLKEQTLTPLKIKEIPIAELENLLHPVSFYKNKAKYLKQTVDILLDKYDSDIPDNPKELIALPGVGPKMAHICMAVAWNKITGIGVDVHVHRLSNRLGWLPKPTKEPEQTRVALEKWLPFSLWSEVNHLFVGFGQTICTPVKPNCGECLNKDICPSVNVQIKPKKKSDR
ncbi:endonuclease III-like protein 1 isoform X1 [Drosophila ficusphila]|uniref:endonuclease III-like protein 1 isoform X1 n=1 Tax=Drosophila ficusphila TaxID=30025 RepID=UPI001C89F11D|nr:endonuclease III-like protein 1 isoform X1 [Drosophila ficusphila]